MRTVALVILAAAVASSAACDRRFHLVGQRGALADAGDDDNPGKDGGTGGSGGRAPFVPNTGGAAGDGGPGDADAGVGTASPPLVISASEALTRVTRVLWESSPDAALVALADSGAVQTNEDVRKIALDILADPRARVGVASFFRWWLRLDRMAFVTKSASLFPQFSTNVGAMMVAETEAFGVDVTLNGDGSFRTLMRAPYSFLNESLAGLYGVTGVTGSELRKVNLDPTHRAGILTQLSLMTINSSSTDWTSPTRRGVLIADRVLCADIAPPPPEVPDPGPVDEPPGALTNRQRLEKELTTSGCAACHQGFDPLGLAYETFDSVGRLRLMDSGLPIDTSGRLPPTYGDAPAFDDAIGLAGILAELPMAHRCMGSSWLEYMLGRTLREEEGPLVAGIYDRFQASNLSLPALIAAALSSPAFLQPSGGPPCTPGLSQTCNDSPSVSSLFGTCSPAGKCVCRDGASLNPTTGRCQ